MRRIVLGFVIAVVAVIVVIVLALSFINVNRFRPTIEAEMQKKLNRPVKLGEMHLQLLPLSIRVDGLTIGESAAFPSSAPFATAKEVYASAGLFSLLTGKPHIDRLTLQNPDVELIRNAAGEWNFSDLGGNQTGGSSDTSLALDKLQIKDGQVAVTDQHTKTARTVYNHIDLSLSDFAPGKQFGLDAAAHLSGPGKELVSFNGKAGPLQPGNTPVDGRVSIQQVSLAALDAVSGSALPAGTNAVASGSANITTAGDTIGCTGTLNLTDATVHGTKLAYPVDAQYDLSLNQKTDQAQIKSGTVKIGATAVSLAGLLNSGTKPASVNMHVSTNKSSVQDLLNLASLAGGSSSASGEVKGTLSANLTLTGPVTGPNVTGDLSSSSLQLQEIVLSNVHSSVNMQNGVVHLAPVTAGIFGGQETGNITLDTKPAHPLCSVQAKLSGVDTNALLTAVSSLKDTLYGSLAADANLSFAVDSGANLARTLNGTLGFNVTNGRLKNVNILSELSKVGKFLNSAPSQNVSGTALQRLSGTMNIQNGVATTNNLAAAMAEGSLAATGSLNLVSQTLDMHATAVLSNAESKQVGGTGIGGFLNSALSNNKGELVLPVLVTGNMSHPVFTPDMQALSKMKLSHLLPTAADAAKPGGVLGSVLGGALGQSPSNQKNNQQQPQNPINSILKQFGK